MPGLELGPLGTHPSLPPPPGPGRGGRAPTFFADLHLVREFLVLGQFLGQRGQRPAKGRGPLPPAAQTPRSPRPSPRPRRPHPLGGPRFRPAGVTRISLKICPQSPSSASRIRTEAISIAAVWD